MYCEYCHSTDGVHATMCPNYSSPRSNYRCCYCDESILDGEEYIKNYDGEYIHRDCIPCTDYLIDWLGYKVDTMENCNDGDYEEDY